MNHSDIAALMKGAAPVIRDYLAGAVQPLVDKIAELEGRLNALPKVDAAELKATIKADVDATIASMKEEHQTARAEGKEKRKAALADLKAGILADCGTIVSEQIAAIPAPKETDLSGINEGLEDLRKAIDNLPPVPELPDIPAVIAEAIEAAKPEPVDYIAIGEMVDSAAKAQTEIAIAAIPPAPEAPVIPDVAAMIADAIEAAKPEPVDVKGMIDEAIAGKVDPEFEALAGELQRLRETVADPELTPTRADMAEYVAKALAEIPVALTADETKALISEAIAALPPAENGKDADPELVASLVAETVERAVASLPVAKDGAPGADGVTLEELLPVIDQTVAKAVSAIPVPKDGRNAVDLADLLVIEGGDVVATFTDGRTKVLGPFRGKDGEPGKDGCDVDVAAIEKLIDDKIAKIAPPEIERDAYLAEFAPEDVASNVSLAVKMMAAMPQTVQTQQRSEAPPINIHSNVSMPEIKFPENMVNVSMPEMTVAAPIVNVDPVTNNVMPDASKKRKEITTVTGWDKNGRITSFEKTEADQ